VTTRTADLMRARRRSKVRLSRDVAKLAPSHGCQRPFPGSSTVPPRWTSIVRRSSQGGTLSRSTDATIQTVALMATRNSAAGWPKLPLIVRYSSARKLRGSSRFAHGTSSRPRRRGVYAICVPGRSRPRRPIRPHPSDRTLPAGACGPVRVSWSQMATGRCRAAPRGRSPKWSGCAAARPSSPLPVRAAAP
jgi:hypothetical protein